MKRNELKEYVKKYLVNLIVSVTKLPEENVLPNLSFELFGIDSMMILELNKRFAKDFGQLSKTLFFEYENIDSLADYFVENHYVQILSLMNAESTKQKTISKPKQRFLKKSVSKRHQEIHDQKSDDDYIAIIGVGGKYPMADTLDQFWNNLKEGKDCITEIPKERWDYNDFYDKDKSRKDKVYTKWGGFISDVDKFDLTYFNMSKRESIMIDPAERLFLEASVHTFDDAGYSKQKISNTKTGVFVGVMYGQYQMYVNNIDRKSIGPTSSYASVANRVSYFFNLHGPSMAVDTMCSSSLTAFHLACESIKRGECEQAIAGGVNVCIHPAKYIILSQQRYASTDGKCRTFGEGGDGYVPGEGVGAVLLKPLKKAKQDKNQIYAVVKSSTINHDGKTNGYTVPNPNAQADLVSEALEKADINSETISYIEAHGTGTALGDPIEITGLVKAFAKSDKKLHQYCAIGSVKSNIGHCEAAAGIAAITKVILQMKYKTLVPSLNSDKLNSNIDFQATPFYVQHEMKPWKRPVINNKVYPRCAGISAFGAGGNNVHVILEEYDHQLNKESFEKEQLIILSDHSEERLQTKIKQMLEVLKCQNELIDKNQMTLENIAYTLQVGREEMEYRVAFTCSDIQNLLILLEQCHQKDYKGVSYYNASENIRKIEQLLLNNKGNVKKVEEAVKNRNLSVLKELWVQGYPVDFKKLNENSSACIISLPSYEFIKERCWVDCKRSATEILLNQQEKEAVLHPFIDYNLSTIHQQKYRKVYSFKEQVIREHVVLQQNIVAGAVLLETARAAGTLAYEKTIKILQDVMWAQPVVLKENRKTVDISITEENTGLAYNISNSDNDKKAIYVSGKLITEEPTPANRRYSLESIRRRCKDIHSRKEIEKKLQELGFNYGPSYLLTETLYCGEWESLAELNIPEKLLENQENVLFQPMILDCVLRSALGIKGELFSDNAELRVPYRLEKIEILRTIPKKCTVYAYIPDDERSEWGENIKSNFVVLDENGDEVVRILGFQARRFKHKNTDTNDDLLYYSSKWEEESFIEEKNCSGGKNVLVLCNDEQIIEKLNADGRNNYIFVIQGEKFEKQANGIYKIKATNLEHIDQVLKDCINVYGKISYILNMWNYNFNFEVALECLDLQERNTYIKKQLNSGLYTGIHLFKLFTREKINEKVRYIALFKEDEYSSVPTESMFAAASKSVLPINNKFIIKTVQVVKSLMDNRLCETIERIIAQYDLLANESRFTENKIYGKELYAISDEGLSNHSSAIKSNGTYVITGGLGGLGYIFSTYIAKKYQSRLILLGRSELSKESEMKITELRGYGSQVTYYACDVCDFNKVDQVVRNIGEITGIIHCAGIINQTSIMSDNMTKIEAVIAPKLYGTMNLDIATKDHDLDFIVLFSSISAIVGDYGCVSYASANKFMDEFSNLREELRKRHKRNGKTICINWPLWNNGGMQLPDGDISVMYYQYSGMERIDEEAGLKGFENSLKTEYCNIMILRGNKEKIEKALKIDNVKEIAYSKNEFYESPLLKNEDKQIKDLQKKIVVYLKNILAKVLETDPSNIDENSDLERYGIDSIIVMDISTILEKDFGQLPKTLFFEFGTLNKVGKYFIENHKERVIELFGLLVEKEEINQKVIKRQHEVAKMNDPKATDLESDDIAIIGVSARFPESETIEQFWENLRDGKDCISLIPKTRWDNNLYYSEDNKKKGGIYTQWGGFIKDIDKFDPIFFNIAPREAEAMDPQERIFLEEAYHAVENAGYSKRSLYGKKVGVFVGAMYAQYQLFGIKEKKGEFVLPESFFSNIANRLSYFMNFSGPSLTLDTACSSSLETIRQACLNIQNNECEMAIAGGVNLSLHPRKYQFLCGANFLSTDGRCRSFGEGGDGYVPGEGVGAVLLKPLRKARRDGDYIYGVIKGYATNHGGKTNGYSVPNPNAQEAVIVEAVRKANIPLETISYIECHGTGTSLGDPIEILGLDKAFANVKFNNGVCAIGSVKSNIGHLESAAGISGVVKILLQMQHKKLVKSLHSERLNPYIHLDESRFKVQQSYEDWKVIAGDKRRALISAFGAGGTNVSLILEEYKNTLDIKEKNNIPNVILLSAKNKDRLREYASNLYVYLTKVLTQKKKSRNYISIQNLAYTLQHRENEMNERLAFFASSLEDVTRKLSQYLDGNYSDNEIFVGTYNKNREEMNNLLDDEERNVYFEQLINNRKVEKLAKLWVRGFHVSWSEFYEINCGKKIPLPGYPFAKERYWINEVEEPNKITPSSVKNEMSSKLCLYGMKWKEYEYVAKKIDITKRILIVNDSQQDAKNDLKILRNFGIMEDYCINIVYGKEFCRTERNYFVINKNNSQDFVKLFEILKKECNLPEIILFLNHEVKIEETEYMNDFTGKDNIYSIFSMIKAIASENVKNKIKMVYVHGVLEDEVNPYAESIFGYSLSLKQANKNIDFLTILKSKDQNEISLLDNNLFNLIYSNDIYQCKILKIEKNKFYIREYSELMEEQSSDSLNMTEKVWVITGGFGSLGLAMARHLSNKYQAKIALLGRSPLNDENLNKLKSLKKEGMDIIYTPADVSNQNSVRNAIVQIKETFGGINAVIHAAGIYNNQMIVDKELTDIKKCLSPKIQGSMILEQELARENLDVFIMFSSLSAVLGDFGQCDYSIGNCFLLGMARYRERLRRQGLRNGKTITINWPLWRDGGMHGSSDSEKLYLKTSGMSYLDTENGMKAFDKCLESNQTDITVIVGEKNKADNILNTVSHKKTSKAIKSNQVVLNHTTQNTESVEETLLSNLKEMAAQIIHLDQDRLNEYENFGEYGFDSISLKEFSEAIESGLGVEVLPTVFYAHSNLKDLSKYLMEEYREKIKEVCSLHETTGTVEKIQEISDITSNEEPEVEKGYTEESIPYIAIIGADGVFPQSDSIEEFWENLINEKDMVTEIPKNRWNFENMYSPEKGAKNKSISKWGGFINDVDKFDAQFFNISPKEAELMDPQQRLFLQSSWKVIEDAGYKASSLSGKNIGVFVGASFNDYQNMIWDELGESRVQIPVGNMLAMLSNRVSYFMNFKGPSEVVNTACSSSMVAIHRAVTAINNGECEMAIAGGVSLSLSPMNYIIASKLEILSPDGKCKAFDESANGFVKGEGVGSILLKPLNKAIEDHDHIYAVICATNEKHGGKASSITAPDSESQAELIIETHEKALVNPNSISYIETHGTGTELGDPIEVDGLKKAFSSVKNKTNYCGLGSVKSNIGHLEPAAGIASVIKVLMAMKYEVLPTSLYVKKINPYIKLENSPFYIVNKMKKWGYLKDIDGNEMPLRAGISSFGFGGTNVYMILEKMKQYHVKSHCNNRPFIFVFSAKNQKRLFEYSAKFRDFLAKRLRHTTTQTSFNNSEVYKLAAGVLQVESNAIDGNDSLLDIGFEPFLISKLLTKIEQRYSIVLNISDVTSVCTLNEIIELIKDHIGLEHRIVDAEMMDVNDVAYTLQIGREEMNERLAIIADNLEDLYIQLKKYVEGEQSDQIYTCNTKDINLTRTEVRQYGEVLKQEMLEGNYSVEHVAKEWTKGISIDWTLFYDTLPYKVSLPTYSFAKKRHWIKKKSPDLLEILDQLQRNNISIEEADNLIMQQASQINKEGEV